MGIANLKRLSSACLSRIHAAGWIGVALLFMVGIVSWVGFNFALDVTNTEEFCISCHEMKVNSYEEYRLSAHATNPSGMSTRCPDCHVPRAFGPKIVAKLIASKDVYHNLLGTIDTSEKFSARRLEMAEVVWARMKGNDSRECRECHSEQSFDYAKQSRRAAAIHEEGVLAGQTCIDCHKGVAHFLPPIEQSIGEEKGGVAPDVFNPISSSAGSGSNKGTM